MLWKRLFFVVTTINVLLLSDIEAVQDWNFKFGKQLANEHFGSETIEIEKLSKKLVAHDNCGENCNERNPKTLTESNSLCPYKSKELCLIFSLSKIAKVQAAALSQTSTGRGVKENIFDGATKSAKSSKVDGQIKEKEEADLDYSERIVGEHLQNFSGKQLKSSNVRCRAIRDVYIPEVKRHLPAFACRFGSNSFILSSARFVQDRRLYLDLNVSESTYKTIKSTPKVSRSNEFNVIPALLVLNVANNNYRIEMHENIPSERKVKQEEGNR